MRVRCGNCGWRVAVNSELPTACQECGDVWWQSVDEPSTPYTLSHNDRRFLKSLRIDPEFGDGDGT